MKIERINSESFDKYVLTFPQADYYQSSAYGNLMHRFKMKERYLAFLENGQIKGACMLISKPLFLYYQHAYIPRGIITHYEDLNTLDNILKCLKQYLTENNFLDLKMIPPLVFVKRTNKGKVYYKDTNIASIMKVIKNNGFIHKGFNSYFESPLPRFEAELDISKLNADQLFTNLNKNTRNKLRKATKYGLVIYKDNKFEFSKVASLFKNNYLKVHPKYFEQLHKTFGNNCELYYALLDTEKYVENSRINYEKELGRNDYFTNIIQSNGYKGKDINNILNLKMESDKILSSYKKYMVEATEILKSYPKGVIMGASIILTYNNKAFIIYEGYNKVYKNLCIPYLLKWKIIEKYAESDIKFINLGGISGEKDYKKNRYSGLNESKLGFNASSLEYLGEFNIIINKKVYAFYNKFIKKK